MRYNKVPVKYVFFVILSGSWEWNSVKNQSVNFKRKVIQNSSANIEINFQPLRDWKLFLAWRNIEIDSRCRDGIWRCTSICASICSNQANEIDRFIFDARKILRTFPLGIFFNSSDYNCSWTTFWWFKMLLRSVWYYY